MKVAVWVLSGLLAVTFLFTGLGKLLASTADLESMAQGVPVLLLRVAGTAEVLGALGLILPAVTRILPVLTPLAAAGLTLTMIGATVTNLIIGEYAIAAFTVLLGALAGCLGWARHERFAIEPRHLGQPSTT